MVLWLIHYQLCLTTNDMGKSNVCQWDAENLQDFIGRASQVHIMLDNSHKTVCCNSHTDLYANSVLRCAPEFLYLKMLLEPFEEQFNQPSFLMKIGDIQCWKMTLLWNRASMQWLQYRRQELVLRSKKRLVERKHIYLATLQSFVFDCKVAKSSPFHFE